MARDAGEVASKLPHCALCGAAIKGKPVARNIEGKKVVFDSDDHARIYETAFKSGLLDQILTMPANQKRNAISGLQKKSSINFAVGGMYCESCATTAESVLKATPGVADAAVSFGAALGRVEYDPAKTNPEELMHKMHKMGYHTHMADVDEDETASRARSESILIKLIVAIAFGMQIEILYLSNLYPSYARGIFGTPGIKNIEYITMLLALPIFFYSGSVFLRGAWQEIKVKTVAMDTLVAIGITASFAYSVYMTIFGRGPVFFDSTALIVTFVSIGRYLESIGGDKARDEVRTMLDINPKTARMLHNGKVMEMPASSLKSGDKILVDAGDLVPADATVTKGEASLNESLVTGESTPVLKSAGSSILAGSAVASGSLTATVDKPFDQSRLAQMTVLVKETLHSRPPIQQLADRASAWLTFAILGIAVTTTAIWSLIGHSLGQGILAGVAVLVVACPCALGIATPLAITVALGRAVKAGVAIRNPVSLEMAGDLNHMVFDKTGTLTVGRPVLSDSRTDPRYKINQKELLCLAASVEQFSSHPVGRAITAACPNPAKANGFVPIAGMGGKAVMADNTTVMVGTESLIPAASHSPLAESARKLEAEGQSVVWIQSGDDILGYLALDDQADPQADKVARELSDEGMGIEILSGDSPKTVQSLAASLNIKEYTGSLFPKEKAEAIRSRQSAALKVGMVGDGANDALALAQADVSFTVASGTTIAGETSDVLLIRDDLRLVAWFIKLSRATNHIIKQNLGWAIVYNLVAVPLAAFGIIRPAIAAIAMATSSLIVVANSLRLKRIKVG